MRFAPPSHPTELARSLPRFLSLVGERRWFRRSAHLEQEAGKSPFLAKIVMDFHWLELELQQKIHASKTSPSPADPVSIPSFAALQFATMVCEVHRKLSKRGQNSLVGRLRDSLKNGFAGLYLEMEMARQLLEAGYDVDFPDFEGIANFDLLYSKDDNQGEIECKSLSPDAGRKVHRRDYYRFVDLLDTELASLADGRSYDAVVVTVDDRFFADASNQRSLRKHVTKILRKGTHVSERGQFYEISLQPLPDHLLPTALLSNRDYYADCRQAFGDNCHAAGGFGERGGYVFVVRSKKPDDPSRPTLEAIKRGADQLSGARPGFVAIQLEDIRPRDLTLPHLRRRVALLANGAFHLRDSDHLAGVHYCAYAGLYKNVNGIAMPGFVCPNPKYRLSSKGLPFQSDLTNSEFSTWLGVDPAGTDPDGYLYGASL